MANSPIGLFDSGFGGLTVLKEVLEVLPSEDVIYFGDTAHLPYGSKSPEAIVELALENGAFLLSLGIKLLLVACHTASCHALQALQKALPIPVLGVVEPGLDLLARKKGGSVAILGTQSTIQSGIYPRLLRERAPQVKALSIACPLFVPLIEEGFASHPATEMIAREYLAPLMGAGKGAGVEALLLACTHYPLIRPTLGRIVGAGVELIEPARSSALAVWTVLRERGLLNRQKRRGERRFFVSEAPEKFGKWGPLFLGEQIERIELKKIRIREILASGLYRE